MGQVVEFQPNGITSLSLGDNLNNVDLIEYVKVKSDENHYLWFVDHYDYYFVNTKVCFDFGITIDSLFIATDKLGKIVGIIIISNRNTMEIFQNLRDFYGEPSINSFSSIEKQNANKKWFWKVENRYSLIYRETGNCKRQEVLYVVSESDLHMPGVTINN
ncbi:MAG: hypothetical protein ACK5OP_12960 [Sphingobacteriales bacterium]|jgi:hypothetical protein